jgi:hypothetical protein
MTMIPSGGATVFSSPPLCRARGLCFFLPSLFCPVSLLPLWFRGGSVGGGWEERWRRWWRCNGGSSSPLLRCFFFLRHFLFFPSSLMASLSLLCLLSWSPSFSFSFSPL